MKIIVDMQARQLLEQVCDSALKNNGIGSLNQVNTLLANAENYVPENAKAAKDPEGGE